MLSVLALTTKNIKQDTPASNEWGQLTFAYKSLGESEIDVVVLRLDRLTPS